MTVTKQQAIVECKKLWKDIKLSGLSKNEYFHTHRELQHKWYCNCPLCDWVTHGSYVLFSQNNCCPNTIRICPLIKQYKKTCYQLGFADGDGNELRVPSKEWLKVIKELKGG